MFPPKYIFHTLLALLLFASLGACSKGALSPSAERPFTYHEFDGIFVIYETDRLDLYRELLPTVFDMPEKPLVLAFFMDYYKMDAATEPYKESAVFLLADYKNQPAWHCITMPVTSDAARRGGIYYLGYPKIMADIDFDRKTASFSGEFRLKQKKILSLTLDTVERPLTDEEHALFARLPHIRSLNLLNGRIFEPKFGASKGKRPLPQVATMAPDKFKLQVGTADLFMDSDAAGTYSERLGKLFSVKPTRIVLAYYMQNKFVLRFEN